jgi:hypothetical protein
MTRHFGGPDPKEDQKTSRGASAELSGRYICRTCDIAFMDVGMYSRHKDCHDDDDPLRCAKCGAALSDARQFFAHLMRDPHVL